ncbi:MAG TPA: PDZ domain-containing protein [Vicinamibacterales bacterium]|nr:PDZ domain-containing protein [Vicinamibacterales bacterium]
MSAWKAAGLAGAVIGVLAGAVLLAPSLRGQAIRASDDGQMVQLFVGSNVRVGVRVRDVDEEDVRRQKLQALAGALIEEVRRNSPAEKAGLRAGDVIVEFDGERVRSARHFARLVDETPEGKDVPATVVRGGERVTVSIRPERARGAEPFFDPAWSERLAREAERAAAVRAEAARRISEHMQEALERGDVWYGGGFASPSGWLGVRVQELTPQLAEYFGVKDGVLVASVEAGSAAEKAGVKAGDVITSVAGTAVTTAADLRRELRRAGDQGQVEIEVVRDRKPTRLTVQLERRARRPARPTVER